MKYMINWFCKQCSLEGFYKVVEILVNLLDVELIELFGKKCISIIFVVSYIGKGEYLFFQVFYIVMMNFF